MTHGLPVTCTRDKESEVEDIVGEPAMDLVERLWMTFKNCLVFIDTLY